MMEVHVWGAGAKLAIVDAECLAIVWLLALTVPKDKFKVVTSSNVDLSDNGKLPLLRDEGGVQVEGFINIVRYLSEKGYSLDGFLDMEHQAINHGLILFIQDKLHIITDYTLYLNKDNYEKYTRSIYGKYLGFPLQYNTPIHYRSLAKTNCARIDLTVEDKTEIEEEMLKNVPTVSKIQQLQNESMIEEKLLIKNSLTNMKCLNKLKKYIDIILNLKKEIGIIDEYNLLSNKLTTSDLLLIANLFVITNKVLPDQFISSFLTKFYPSLAENYLAKNLKVIDKACEGVSIQPATFSDSPNLFNKLRYSIF